jgi:hypothetical protein
MLVGGEGSRKISHCHGLYGVAWVCNASAATPASHYASLFKSSYNDEAKANNWPYRISWISCVASSTRGYYDCGVKTKLVRGSRVQCGVIVIDTGFDVLVNHLVPCKNLAPPTNTA